MSELRHLKVGRRLYKVVRQHLSKDFGIVNLSKGVIRIDDPQPPLIVLDTTLHEILHAIWADRHLPDRPSEERVVTALGQGLANLFRDNPGLLVYLEQLAKASR